MMRVKDYLLKFIAGLLCVVMAAILIALFFMNHVRNAERAEQVQQKSDELKQIEEEKKETAADLYDELLSSFSMRSIVCWGDSEMAGSEDLSLPKSLKEVANENLFTDTTVSFANAMDKEADTTLSVTVNNMGVRHEGMREILARAGVNELQIGEWTVLPAETEPHDITFKDDVNWSPLYFAEQSQVRFGETEIAGVTGALTVGEGEYDEDHPIFAFVRDEEGDSVVAGAGTTVTIASATKYIGDIPVFFFEDDSADSVDEFVEDLESLVDRYTEDDGETEESEDADGEEEYDADEGSTQTEIAAENETASEGATDSENAAEVEPTDSRCFVVICTAEEDSELDNALWEAFGSHYIRNNTYASEMNEDRYKELAEKVFENLDSQGCFDDVRRQTEAAVEKLGQL